jgi:UDP-N-acetyl-D-glucosamine dehydrogenase
VPEIAIDGCTLKAGDEAELADADCVLIVTDHTAFDYKSLPARAKLVVDTRNALKGIQAPNIVRL